MTPFKKCTLCTDKSNLCEACRHNHTTIEALTEVYAAAASLRRFPVPFDDHIRLVDAVDKCRPVLEPTVDEYDLQAHLAANREAHIADYHRQEFFAAFREAHATLHRLWTAQVGVDGYDKVAWKILDNALARFARDAADKYDIGRSELLL